ncbi:MAG TPA: acetoacetate--CoA ligase [Acidimicrobiales bacterium]|nr:acetoacetate--CoA ligase [Acidimicrobiales bacterium]
MPLWEPSADRQKNSRLARFLDEAGLSGYDEAWAWSVDPATAGAFWARVADTFGVPWHDRADQPLVRDGSAVTGARWFPGATLNYAEMCLARPGTVLGRSQTRPDMDLTGGELRSLVARVRAGLVAAGVGRGDRVAGYLPNIPETLAVMLATASLGAVWTCCAPEMGVSGSLDRLSQAQPTVLVSVDGYRYGARSIDRHAEAEAIRAGLASLRRAVWLPYLDPAAPAPAGWEPWSSFTAAEGPLEFEPVPFDHPLYILFSSGTTGKPKAIVHGHGGITLEHTKALALHFDLGPESVFFWFTTTGWMMWNFCVSGLLTGSSVVLYDGDPAGPSGDRLWEIMAATGTTCGGVGAGYLVAGMKAGHRPGAGHDLSRLSVLGSTGSPLPAAAAEWVYSSVAPDVLLASFSGGTDVCTGFVGASPLHPVWAGEISCRCLGAAVEVFDDDGRPVVGDEGELVITQPLPSMPVGILGDESGDRYRATYFERFPGIWAHGDRATLTERGTLIITGRSDGTLNRGGVRMGTAEFYSVVEGLDEVADSLAVHLEDPDGGPGRLLLFVVPAAGADPDRLADLLRATLRQELSPRHVPDAVHVVAAVPRTLSGKKLEVPVKRILAGVPVDQAVTLASVAEPSSLDFFLELARRGA